ncbi:hypothetical protein N8I77_009737 [Diaporthe amygdali]|uniref:FAD-binding PCMH-type domain-containing protein n=1 Tax=Phomopsis amygdali TaxID=1214568 RepID=A0AAD9SA46_PHOAM|nr:hypothetical protein N8I77_009737 [Diaporthe amygdali]
MDDLQLPVVWRDEPESSQKYEAQRRRVFTLRVPNRYPISIVRPRNVAQVVSAVKLAVQKDVRVAIRSGGHSWACWSLRQDSVLIDLVDFKHLSYNYSTEILEASPGTIGTELAEYLRPRARFLPAGHFASVALGGFILQGGMGLNARGFGWAASFLQAIDVVTAKGEILHCDKEQHSDLFWAARGAGPGFPAVVTRFYLKTMPAFPIQLNSTYIYPIAEYDALKTWINEILPNLHRNTEPVFHIMNDPDQGYFIAVLVVARAQSEAEARSYLQVLVDTHPPNALKVTEQQPSDEIEDYEASWSLMPPNHRWVADNVYLDNNVDLAETVKAAFTSLPKGGIAYWEPMNPVSPYKDAGEDEWHETWIRKSMNGLRKSQKGAYLGDKDLQFHDTKYWSDEAGKKLMLIRKKWDPEGRICGYLDKNDESGVHGIPNKLG